VYGQVLLRKHKEEYTLRLFRIFDVVGCPIAVQFKGTGYAYAALAHCDLLLSTVSFRFTFASVFSGRGTFAAPQDGFQRNALLVVAYCFPGLQQE